MFVRRAAFGASLCLLLVVAAQAQEIPGCILPVGYDRAQPPRINTSQTALLPGPRLRLESIRRGFDDGVPRSCSNAGVLTLRLDPRDVAPTDVYSFEVATGRLPADLLPEGYVEPIELPSGDFGFRFLWLDLPAGSRELAPLVAVVRINRVSFSGNRSEAMLLDVLDPGGTAATTARNWNSSLLWAVVAGILLVLVWLRTTGKTRRRMRRKNDLEEIQARLRELANDKKRS